MVTSSGVLGAVTDNADGTYSAVLTSSAVVGSATVSFTVNGVAAVEVATVAFIAGAADAAMSTIGASPTSIVADGVSTSVVTVSLNDASGNPLSAGGDDVVMVTSSGVLGAVTDNADGTYSAVLTSSAVVGSATVSFTVNGVAAVEVATVAFTAGASSPSDGGLANTGASDSSALVVLGVLAIFLGVRLLAKRRSRA